MKKEIMQVYRYPGSDDWKKILQRPLPAGPSPEKMVRKILKKVREDGDRALRKYAEKFDGIKLKHLAVTQEELAAAENSISQELKAAILQAKENITAFHIPQKDEIKKIETMPGVVCWRKSVAIEKIGLYIPGGSAPLFSTVLMLGVPAQLAGCMEIILCTPVSGDGKIHPAILYAAQLCGIRNIFKTGGAQAIAAMAYGTETIPKVFKIFGPGNQYVTLAKQLVQEAGVAIDMPAGPSEIFIIADETAVPGFVAADLLSQAEHGPGSQVILATTSESLLEKAMTEIRDQSENLPRKKIVLETLAHSKLILLKNIQEAMALSNLYAPEHLLLACKDAEKEATRIISAGSVFLGNYSPESAGDYASGTNHTLPTNGYAAMCSGVSIDSFVKKISFQQLTKEGLEHIAETVMQMAAAEGLDAHKNAVSIRLKKQL